MNILIFGASGMLGHAIFHTLSSNKNLTVYGSIRSDSALSLFSNKLRGSLISNIDVENESCLELAYKISKPDVVINCIGIIKQISDAKNILKTIPINALLPHKLADLSKNYKSRLILISTDCVFSGATGNYTEDDFPDCNDLYGRSKFLGEIDSQKNILTIRTSIIGHEIRGGHSLVNWFLSQEGKVNGYSKAIFSGLPTNELAKVIMDIILFHTDIFGLYHVASSPISKLELLKIISKVYDKEIILIDSSEVEINRSLCDQKFRNATGYKHKEWVDLIEGMKKFNLLLSA
jgi:dTDP-4-dehydrorhamnose reductase